MSGGTVEEFTAKLGWEIETSALRTFQQQAASLRGDLRNTFYGGVAAVTALGAAIWKVSSSFSIIEDAEASFTPLLGSVERATVLVEQLNLLASKTPFEFRDLAAGANQMLPIMNGNIGDTVASIKMLGDVSGGNAQRMQSIIRGYTRGMMMGVLNKETLNIISEAQVPIYDQLTKVLGYSSKSKMFAALTAGKISAEDLTKTFQAMTSKGGIYFNGMEIASRTLSGKISTLRDDINMALAEVGKQLSPTLKELADDLSGGAGSVREWAKANGELIRSGFKEFVKDIRDIFKTLVNMGRGIKDLVKYFGGLNNSLKIAAGLFVAVKLSPFLSALEGVVRTAPSAGAAIKAMTGGANLAGMTKWGAIIGAVWLALDDIQTFSKGGDSAIGRYLVKPINDAIGAMYNLNAVQKQTALDMALQWTFQGKGFFGTMADNFIGGLKLIGEGINAVGNFINAHLSNIWNFFAAIINDVIAIPGKMAEGVASMFSFGDYQTDRNGNKVYSGKQKSAFEFLNPFSDNDYQLANRKDRNRSGFEAGLAQGDFKKRAGSIRGSLSTPVQKTESVSNYAWSIPLTINVPNSSASADQIAKVVVKEMDKAIRRSRDDMVK
jgi:tape measure domain-containing protein